ncbi:hypothetical protein ACFLX5_04530 [Chloroflexota bacterium]
MPTREEMEKQGWRQATLSGGKHLSRTLEMYHELGMETHLEEASPEECGNCTECYQVEGETLYRVYTRARGDTEGER